MCCTICGHNFDFNIFEKSEENLREKSKDTKSKQIGGTHYKDMEIQPWHVAEKWFSSEEYKGYHKITALAYIGRSDRKGGIEDIEKAIHHLEELVRFLKSSEEHQPKNTKLDVFY